MWLPGRAHGWDGGGGALGDGFWAGTGWVHSLLTAWMLELSMEATEVEAVAGAMAVWNWLESAARCAVWLCPVEVVGVVFCECRCRLHGIMATLWTYSMLPE